MSSKVIQLHENPHRPKQAHCSLENRLLLWWSHREEGWRTRETRQKQGPHRGPTPVGSLVAADDAGEEVGQGSCGPFRTCLRKTWKDWAGTCSRVSRTEDDTVPAWDPSRGWTIDLKWLSWKRRLNIKSPSQGVGKISTKLGEKAVKIRGVTSEIENSGK